TAGTRAVRKRGQLVHYDHDARLLVSDDAAHIGLRDPGRPDTADDAPFSGPGFDPDPRSRSHFAAGPGPDIGPPLLPLPPLPLPRLPPPYPRPPLETPVEGQL